MKIAIAHLGSLTQSIPASSIVKMFSKFKFPIKITWISLPEYSYAFKNNKYINRSISLIDFLQKKDKYDLFINLFPVFPIKEIENKTDYAMGLLCDNDLTNLEKCLLNIEKNDNLNIFQIYYSILGIAWKGEGYGLSYFPQSKNKKNRIGVSVANANLRNYVSDHLKTDNAKLWHIPYKKNIFKKMDEINKCEKIITDDLLVLHLSLYLRKYVYFLKTFPLFHKIEFFNSGEIHNVKLDII